MLLAFPYYHGDQALALGLAQWMAEMGGCKGHKVLIVRDQGSDPDKDVLIKLELDKSFDSSEVITITGDVFHSWPQSQNLMWSQTARHIQFHTKEPWLWFESDVVILKENWLDLIEAEYKSCQKLFMGDLVNVHGIPPHMSGVAVWPGEVVQYAGVALISQDVAFDMAAKDQVLPQMHKTDLIAHAWDRDLATGKGNRVFENYEQVEREVLQPHPNAVIFHADKSGSLIRLLNEKRRGLLVNPEWEKASHEVDPTRFQFRERSLQERKLTTDIFIKTYPADHWWLRYCIRSIGKFVTRIRNCIIATPDWPDLNGTIFAQGFGSGDSINYKVEPIIEHGEDGYLSQQIFKLNADKYTNAGYILHLDSDTIFTRPVTPETFFKDGNPIWMMTPIEQVHPSAQHAWRKVMTKFMGKEPEYEFMRRFPFVFPRWLYQVFRDFCQEKHGVTIEQYIMSQPYREFTEFNCIGFYAWEFHRDKFSWFDTSLHEEKDWPVLVVNQKQSVGGLTEEIKQEFESILGGTVPTSEKTEAICSPDAAVPPDFEVIEIGGAVSENSPHGPEIVEVNPEWKQANAETLSPSELQPEETGERSFTKERIKGMIQLSPDLYKRGEDLIALDPSKPCSLRTQTDAIGFRVDPNQTTIGKSECEVRSVSSVEKLDGKQGVKPTNDFGSDELRARMASEKPLPVPWKDKEASQKEVDHYCAVLAMFCGAPIYKKRVRDALRKVKIIP